MAKNENDAAPASGAGRARPAPRTRAELLGHPLVADLYKMVGDEPWTVDLVPGYEAFDGPVHSVFGASPRAVGREVARARRGECATCVEFWSQRAAAQEGGR